MKVVLFCGGLGMRLREHADATPKPMVCIGHRPILWHVMKYYAHYGHTDFILCLGWQSEVIKNYFLNYNECLSNDFVLSEGCSRVQLLNSDIQNWKITFVDTGMTATIGERLKRVQRHLDGEETFLANYTDGLSDVSLPRLIDFHRQRDAIATFMSVRPSQSFHCVSSDDDGSVTNLEEVRETDLRINAGFFVFQHEIFDELHTGEELVVEPFSRLLRRRKLFAMPHDGFYGCMDTFKEKQQLEDMLAQGRPAWQIWKDIDGFCENQQSDLAGIASPVTIL
jgi:glucose-1-phosphate cytidylyltransferase